MTVPIFGPGEFDLERTLGGGQVFGWQVDTQGVWRGVDGDQTYGVGETSRGLRLASGDAASFRDFVQSHLSQEEVRREIVSRCPAMRPAIEAAPGVRLLRPACATQVLLSFACTSNNHLPRIDQMVGTLRSVGPTLGSGGGGPVQGFPSLEHVADLGEEWLRERGFGYRASTLPKACRQAVEFGGEAWLQGLKSVPYSQARLELCKLAGIGPKLADCIALYGLWHGQAVPVDTHLWKAAVPIFAPQWSGQAFGVLKATMLANEMRNVFGDLAGWSQLFLFSARLYNAGSRRQVQPVR